MIYWCQICIGDDLKSNSKKHPSHSLGLCLWVLEWQEPLFFTLYNNAGFPFWPRMLKQFFFLFNAIIIIIIIIIVPLTSVWNRTLCKSLVARLNSRKRLKSQPKNAFLSYPARVLCARRKTATLGWSLRKITERSSEVNGAELLCAGHVAPMGIINC